MSKKKMIGLILSVVIILGLGFAGYHSLHPSAQAVTNHYATSRTKPKRADSIAKRRTAKKGSEQVVTAKKQSSKRSPSKKARTSHKTTDPHPKKVVSKPKVTSEVRPQREAPTKNTYNKHVKKTAPKKECSLTVRGPISTGNKVILQQSDIPIKNKDTVIQVIKRVTATKRVALSYQGSSRTAYVRGIDGLFEFDKGSGSGWLYSVNHKFPGISCGKYTVKNGDNIQWLYTENLGKDRNAPQVKK